jgi:hypothetical protein
MPEPRIAGPEFETGGPAWLAGQRKVEPIEVHAVKCTAHEGGSHDRGIKSC